MNLVYRNCEENYFYFLSFVNSKLEKELSNTIIDKQFLLKQLNLFNKILNTDKNLIVIQKEHSIGYSTHLAFYSNFLCFLKQRKIAFISNSFSIQKEYLLKFSDYFSIMFSKKPKNYEIIDKQKKILFNTLNEEVSEVSFTTTFFDLNWFRGKELNYIFFDNCTYKNIPKIEEVLEDLALNTKVIFTTEVNNKIKFPEHYLINLNSL